MIKQIGWEEWKVGDYRPAAAIAYTPDELGEAYKISFRRECDDLDYYDVALFACDGDYIMLHRYIDLSETTIYLPKGTTDCKGLVLKYLSGIGIDPDKIAWWQDE